MMQMEKKELIIVETLPASTWTKTSFFTAGCKESGTWAS